MVVMTKWDIAYVWPFGPSGRVLDESGPHDHTSINVWAPL